VLGFDVDIETLRERVDEGDLEVSPLEAHDDGVDHHEGLQDGVDRGDKRREDLHEIEEVDEDREDQSLFPMKLRELVLREEDQWQNTEKADISDGDQESLTALHLSINLVLGLLGFHFLGLLLLLQFLGDVLMRGVSHQDGGLVDGLLRLHRLQRLFYLSEQVSQ